MAVLAAGAGSLARLAQACRKIIRGSDSISKRLVAIGVDLSAGAEAVRSR
jgi:hypothetical protein